MHRKQRTVAWLMGVILTIPGLASTSPQKGDTGDSRPVSREACLDTRKVTSFSPLHEKFVYVQGGSGEHYLLTLDRLPPDAQRRILGRPLAGVITFTGADFFSRVCSNMGGTAAFIDSGSPDLRRNVQVSGGPSNMWATAAFMDSGRPVYCRIVRVEAVASKELAQQLVEDRTTPKPKG
jgi:hypothetical protein